MLVVCLTMMGIQSVNAQIAIAALHHEGNVTIYSSPQIAIDNSVDGDTVYLSEGMFGEFTINKGVAVIGSGMKTVVAPNITIQGCNIFLSNISLVQNLRISNLGGACQVKVRQCKISGNCIFSDYYEVSDVEISMCHIEGYVSLSSSADVISVINSKIGDVRYSGKVDGSAVFVNCNINIVNSSYNSDRNNFVNCIIGSLCTGYYKNCLYKTDYPSAYKSDCYASNDFSFDNNINCSFDDQTLRDSNYLGTDGTVVGITGGATPYTLASPLLHITDHNMEVDNEQRKLKVTLTLGTEE